jgi:MFS family permease
VLNLVASVSPALTVALAAMVAVGATNIAFNTLARTLLQLNTDPSMHGRVMALHSFVFLGTTPIGGPALGWVCEQWGPRWGLAVAGISALLAAAFVLPRIRRLRADAGGEPTGTVRESPRPRPWTRSARGARASRLPPPPGRGA